MLAASYGGSYASYLSYGIFAVLASTRAVGERCYGRSLMHATVCSSSAPARSYTSSRARVRRRLVIVEGPSDVAAVRAACGEEVRCVRAQLTAPTSLTAARRRQVDVAATNGTPPKLSHARYTCPPSAVARLRAASLSASEVTVFADPDAGGRASTQTALRALSGS